jgi:hypothetical protein
MPSRSSVASLTLWARAFETVGRKHGDPLLLQSAKQLQQAAQQPKGSEAPQKLGSEAPGKLGSGS